MRGTPVEDAQVNVGAGGLREALKKILDEFGLKITDPRLREFGVDDAERPPAEIDGGDGERFVHGHQEISGAIDAALVGESGGDGFGEADTDVFDGVVLVHVEIAGGFESKVEATVAGDEIQHVIEKGDSGGDFGFAAAIEIEAKRDL